MKKFFTSFLFALLSLTIIEAAESTIKKRFITFPNTTDPCKAESISYWNVVDFPFMENIIYQNNVLLAPTTVRWPAASSQDYGTISCTASGILPVNIEVFLAGITDADNMMPGAGINCIVHLGKVGSFGTDCDTPPFDCIENYAMTYSGSDTGDGFDIFTADIALEPGQYEFTCACSDAGPIIDPTTDPNLRWTNDDCPAINSYTNGHITVNGASLNDDCSGTLVELSSGANIVNNLC